MSKTLLISLFLIFTVIITLVINVNGQQKYPVFAGQNCDSTDDNLGLYTCNGEKQSCKAYLIFIAQPRYNTVRAISNLMSSSPEELARINNNEAEYKAKAAFKTNQEVIVPVNCSCSGQRYYQANTSAIVRHSDTYFLVANELFQGLSTCDSLMRANPYGKSDLTPGLALKVPLRCACPTRNQARDGTKYLLTYIVNDDDNIDDLGNRFGVSSRSIRLANGFSEDNEDPKIFNSVPILIPLPSEPSSSQTIIRSDDAENSSTEFPNVFLRPTNPKSKRKVVYVVLAIAAGCSVLALVVVLVLFFFVYQRRKSKPSLLPRRQASRKSLSPEDLRVEIASLEKGLRVFGIEEIRKATEDLCPESRVKGSVYRGVFGEGINERTLAVKRTRKDSSRQVNILRKLNHFNLIKLEGLCKHRDRLYLVFEYMENGSLREWLRENSNNNGSDENIWRNWITRIRIALDIAQGLNYIHSFTKPGFVHKNIKSSNILLNKDMRAKIANFGLAGPATDQTGSATSHVVGTRGYVAPEYLETGISTPKIDVFAFGVVVLELLTGKSAVTFSGGKLQASLSAEIVAIMEGEHGGDDDVEDELIGSFIDCGLKGDHRFGEFALRVAKLSVACLNREAENRPSMSEVVSTLSKILTDLERPEL